MPAELRLHRRLGVLAGLQREGGVGEGRNHLILGEPAELAAILGAGVDAVLFRQGGEIGAMVELVDDRLGFGLGLHQDVAGIHLFGARLAGVVLLVFGLHGGVGHDAGNALLHIGVFQADIGGLRHGGGDGGLLLQFLLARRHEQGVAVDFLVDQQREELGRRHLLQLLRSVLRGLLDVAEMDLHAVDGGDHRVGLGLAGGRGGKSRRRDQAGGESENGERGETHKGGTLPVFCRSYELTGALGQGFDHLEGGAYVNAETTYSKVGGVRTAAPGR